MQMKGACRVDAVLCYCFIAITLRTPLMAAPHVACGMPRLYLTHQAIPRKVDILPGVYVSQHHGRAYNRSDRPLKDRSAWPLAGKTSEGRVSKASAEGSGTHAMNASACKLSNGHSTGPALAPSCPLFPSLILAPSTGQHGRHHQGCHGQFWAD